MSGETNQNKLERFLGGSTSSVVIKLLFLSLFIGAFMAFFNVNPLGLLRGISDLLASLINKGFAAIEDIGAWIVGGATIVVPIFLIARFFKTRSK